MSSTVQEIAATPAGAMGSGPPVYPRLMDGSSRPVATNTPALRICIITPDIAGPNRNGGIGTAFRYAAELLAGAGHQVTVLFTMGARSEAGTFGRWVDDYRNRGIELVPLPEPAVRNSGGYVSGVARAAYCVYEWLKGRTFDVVHVTEWQGTAYYCLLAKNQGLAFANTLFCVKTSSPTLWNMEGNALPVDDARMLLTAHMERRSVELADVVISGSAYMLNWMRSRGYVLPEGRCFVQPNIVRSGTPCPVAVPAPERRSVDELVFFGRLEPRKGLDLFCDALTRLSRHGVRPRAVTFLGKPSVRIDSKGVIRTRAAEWTFPFTVRDNLDQAEAIAYLAHPGRLAVMPSLLDNSPLGVYECLTHDIPFITTDVGGGPELIAAQDRAEVLFGLNPAALAERLARILDRGAIMPAPAVDLAASNEEWLQWHRTLAAGALRTYLARARLPVVAPGPSTTSPLVTACIPHHDRPAHLEQAIHSLEAQTWGNLEVIVVDDGSESPATLEYLARLEPRLAARGWKLIRQQNLYAAAARNTAARHAGGEYLYFLDDDNVAKPHAIETLVRVAMTTGADILTTFADRFTGEGSPGPDSKPDFRLTLAGDALAFGLIANAFGDTHSLVRRDAFRALGGFREEYGVGKEDMEFFARAILRGYQLQLVPEALYWYRQSVRRIRDRHYRGFSGAYRVLAPYLDAVPARLQPLLFLAQGLVEAASASGHVRRLRAGSGSAGNMQSIGELLVEHPRLYRFARRVLDMELRAGAAIISLQLALGRALVRLVMKLRPR